MCCNEELALDDMSNSVYKELKERLIEAGIPDNEIAIIHHYTTESKKVALYQKFNDGEKRILIGSTFKLGTGANIQTKLKATWMCHGDRQTWYSVKVE